MNDTRPTNHADIQELLGAYALDAVAAEEAELVARHLDVCPRCRAEVQEHREVAGLLGYAGQEAPAGLWDRITASMQEAPPALRLRRVEPDPASGDRGEPGDGPLPVGPPRPGTAGGLSAAGALPATGGVSGTGGVPGAGTTDGGGDPRGARPDGGLRGLHVVGSTRQGGFRPAGAGRRSLRTRTLAVLGAAAAVAVVVLGVQVARLDHRTSTIGHEVAYGAPSMSAVEQALTVPGARKVVLRPVADGQTIDAVILPGGQGYLYDAKLTALPSAETYQLWGVTDGGAVSYGLLGSAVPQVVGFRAGDGITALAITAEVAGGVEHSTHAPVAAGAVPPV